ncbi:MAG: NAD(P)H-dependent oxidoreductase [Proteobacteria bacterium]|nr:NAD(P)H-dependent oxidoreductase [Pseudomonadota bacterium]
MKCLVVIAHPLRVSLCHSLAAKAIELLTSAGHEVLIEDLYRNEFSGALTVEERASYYGQTYESPAVQPEIDRLLSAEGLVLCFPTWWFGFPAILKGWFDRTWGPGVAYDHANDLGLIKPRLHGLRKVLVITSLGSPWWVDWIVMRQPVKRVLKTAILGTCASACHFEMLSIYKSERLEGTQVERFAARVGRTLSKWS